MSSTVEPGDPTAVPTADPPSGSPAAHEQAAAAARSRRPLLLKIGLSLVIVAAVVVGIVVAVASVYHNGARPGTLVEDSTSGATRDARKAVVQTPLGALTVQVGRPAQGAPEYDEKKAADGAVWVPLSWQLDGSGADYSNNTSAYQFTVVLVADGHRYDLQAGQSGDDTASKYTPVVKAKSVDVVVQGGGHHLEVEVGYDGVTQTLDVDHGTIAKGLAAPLYLTDAQRALSPGQSCDLLSDTDRRRYQPPNGGRCSIGQPVRTPYVGGLGWVGSSQQTWILVPIDVLSSEIDGRRDDLRDSYDVVSVRYRMTIDGHAATRVLLRYEHQGYGAAVSGVAVFRTANHPKQLQVTLTSDARGRITDNHERTFTSTRTYALH